MKLTVNSDAGDLTFQNIWDSAGNPVLHLADEVPVKDRRKVRNHVIKALNCHQEAHDMIKALLARHSLKTEKRALRLLKSMEAE